MADGYIRVEGWAPELQPGTVTVVSVEDRNAAELARDAAENARDAAELARDAAVSAAEDAAVPIPSGGNTGQVLAKKSGVDRDLEWVNPAVGGSGGTVITGAPAVWPATFPASQHSHPVTEISDATSIGRLVMKANTTQAARDAIGAGTGNGTSNLQLGTTGTTAAPGNHSHAASSIALSTPAGMTATDIQAGMAELAARPIGGGGGTSDTVKVKFASGAYPTQAASAPAGVLYRYFYGPVQYTGPTWAGVLDFYTYAELT